MMKKLIVVLIICAMFFSITGVMAEDSGSSDSGSDDGSSDDSTDDKVDDNSDSVHDSSDDSSGSKDSSSASKDSSSSDNGVESKSSSDSSSKNEVEAEIEHGLLTITTHETEQFNSMSTESASQSSDPSSKSRDTVKIVTSSLTSLSSVSAPTASQLAQHAKTIEDSLSHFSADENAIRTRNGIVTFFFGGDDSAANDIENHINEDIAALEAMDKIMDDPTTSPSLKTFTQQRAVTIRAELERLRIVAENEKQKKGLFG